MVSIVAGARTLTTTAYSPNPLNITRGTMVTWVNNDTSTHNQVADGGAFSTGDVAPGGQASFTFQTAGSFPYHCGRHPGMVATINVQ
jgi:plastocyanin